MSTVTGTRGAATRRRGPLSAVARSRDVGLVRLRSALRILVTVTVGMLAGFAIAGALGIPAAEGLMLGALPAFLTGLTLNDEKPWREAARAGAMLVPFVAAMSLAVLLHGFRIAELVVVVVLMGAQFFSAGLNSWFADAGVGAFSAYLCGLLLPISTGSIPGIAIIFAASLAASIVLRMLFFRPDARRALRSSRVSFVLIAESVLAAASDLLRADDDRARRRAEHALDRRLDRMQDAALIVDGLIASDRSGVRGTFAQDLHRVVFDVELVIETLARSARALESADPRMRSVAAAALERGLEEGARAGTDAADDLLARLTADGHLDPARPAEEGHAAREARRLASTLRSWAATAAEWDRMRDRARDTDDIPFESAIDLIGGRVAGSGPVLDATLEVGGMSGPWRRLRVTSAVRTAIQALVAVAIVEPIALLLGAGRFYWGVIGVLVILAGTSSTHERVRKTWARVWGTVLGGALGIPLALLAAGNGVALTAIAVLALAVGVYYFPIRYGIWTALLVVALCTVYSSTTGLDAGVISLRLVENVVGAVVAVLVSAVVLPVGSPAMVRTAIAGELAAIGAVVADAGAGERTDLRAGARAVDLAQYRLDSVLRPLVRMPTATARRRDDQTSALLESAALAVGYLAAQAQPIATPAAADLERVRAASDRLAASVETLRAAVDVADTAPAGAVWDRIADPRLAETGLETTAVPVIAADALIDRSDADVPERSWADERVRLLGRIDEALATLAARRGLAVES